MERVFQICNVKHTIYRGVMDTDPRLNNANNKFAWSIAYGMLDMIQMFYDSGEDYGCFCENDIAIHKDISTLFPQLTSDMKQRDLDILLIGYLNPNKCTETGINYRTYSDEQWGGQMFILSREKAKYFLDNYAHGYAERTLTDSTLPHFSGDWFLTKDGKRALVYPMLAVEFGYEGRYDSPHQWFHLKCTDANFNPDIHVTGN